MSEHPAADRLGELDRLDETLMHERLRRARIARIGYLDGDQPVIVPVNIAVDEEHRIVFRTDRQGPLGALDGRRVALEIDGYEVVLRSGWSVLAVGVARDISVATDLTAQRLRALPLDCWAPGARDRTFVVDPLSITGRVIPIGADGDWFAGIPAS